MKAYRHWENLLIVVDNIPTDAVELNTNIFATWSHWHNHSISWWKLFKDWDDLYIEAKDTNLLHPEHSPNIWDAKINDWYYKIVTQVEYTPEWLKPVID